MDRLPSAYRLPATTCPLLPPRTHRQDERGDTHRSNHAQSVADSVKPLQHKGCSGYRYRYRYQIQALGGRRAAGGSLRSKSSEWVGYFSGYLCKSLKTKNIISEPNTSSYRQPYSKTIR